MKLVPTVAVAGLVIASVVLSGCETSGTYGVDVVNKTGQILNVTYFDVEGDGSPKPYSTTTVAKNGTLTNRVTHDEHGFGKRVRFSIPDRGSDDPTSHVEFKLSDEKIREYDLVIVNGRLVAKEYKKGRPGSTSENPGGGN